MKALKHVTLYVLNPLVPNVDPKYENQAMNG